MLVDMTSDPTPCEMKRQRIYIDTSVIGGCFDEEFAQWSRGLLHDFHRGRYKPIVSEIVADEVSSAPAEVRNSYIELLTLDHEYLEITEEVSALAAHYQERNILSPRYYYDGVHIALATLARVDLLVSWNFRHIVHYDRIRLFNSVNIEQGYHPLQIYSPRQVTSYGGHEEEI